MKKIIAALVIAASLSGLGVAQASANQSATPTKANCGSPEQQCKV